MGNTVNVLGKIIHYEPETREIIIKASYFNLDDLALIEEAILDDRNIRLKFNVKSKESKRDYQLRCLWGSLTKILLARGFETNRQNLDKLEEEIAESVYPVKKTERGIFIIHLSQQSKEQLDKVIETIHNRYSYLRMPDGSPIDFSDLKVKQVNTVRRRRRKI